MRDFLRRAFLENAALKVVALLLSLTLFIVVRGDRDATLSFDLPVAYTESGNRVLTSRPVDNVRVTVEGPWTRMRYFKEEEVEPLRVDLARLSDGEFLFSMDDIQVPAGLKVTSINPPSIRLVFEERLEKPVPVRPIFEGQLARGHSLDRITVTPPTVVVRGPRAIVEAVTEVRTLPIEIEGRAQGGEVTAELAALEPHLSYVDKPRLQVRYTVSEEQGERLLGPLAIQLIASPGARVAPPAGAQVNPRQAKVLLRGPKNLLERLDPAGVRVFVVWHSEDARGSRPARVQVEGVPPGLAIDVDPRDVTVLPR